MEKTARADAKRADITAPFTAMVGKISSIAPTIPFLDKPTSMLIYASIALYFVFVAAIFLSSQPLTIETGFSEAPLHKNTDTGFLPGETYRYLVIGPNSEKEYFSYEIRESSTCVGALIMDTLSGKEACVLPDGTDNEGKTNASIGDGSFLLFSPWMLAVSDDFGWQLDESIKAQNVQTTVSLRFRSLGKKTIAGRDAYEIELHSAMDGLRVSPASRQRLFIDSEKRVLLLAQLGDVSARLVSAPFALSWNQSGLPN